MKMSKHWLLAIMIDLPCSVLELLFLAPKMLVRVICASMPRIPVDMPTMF